MRTDVIVLNGGSSAGKTEIARLLQALLPRPWLALGVDTLIAAMPNALLHGGDGLGFASDGTIVPGPAFRALEAAWTAGVAAVARAGAAVIIDDVFLSGAASQASWRTALAGLSVLWVGVRCDPDAAALRELARGDRVPGMARSQALTVHEGVAYDITVDTTRLSAVDCARQIAARVRESSGRPEPVRPQSGEPARGPS